MGSNFDVVALGCFSGINTDGGTPAGRGQDLLKARPPGGSQHALASLSGASLMSQTEKLIIPPSVMRNPDHMWKNPVSCPGSASVSGVQERKRQRPPSLPLSAAKEKVCTAPGPPLVPIHLPQHNIIIPNSTTEEEGASLGELGQEQKAGDGGKKLN
ncbi:unnamed protein product [Pleuronectes platessa]|uniref:Uncharacterized protein n=1 Tax=Pleuronectes platessa TaxID=8262 RepID=A0A9N7Z4R4_PLEPL|nr:unnamed protein product [Pleuronectes platessa]